MNVLGGLKVIELGSFITAPFASLLLADLGADVIKVEPPEGDPFRSFGTGKYSPNFVGYNRNKRSVVIDLKSEGGRDAIMNLVRDADVLIENFRPGVMERAGLDYECLKEANPRLVYCAISGFARNGPNRDKPAFDTIGQAMSGLLDLMIDPENPAVRGPTISDQLAGLYASYGILGALYERQNTGKGRRVDVNMIEATMSFMPDVFASQDQQGVVMETRTRAAYSQAYVMVCADGRIVGIQLSSPEKFWVNLTEAIERPDLLENPLFSSRMKRIENIELLNKLLAEVFLQRPRDEWIERLVKADVPHAPVHRIDEVVSDLEITASNSFYEVEHPEMGRVRCIHRPVLFDGLRLEGTPPPVLGEHTEEILKMVAASAKVSENQNT
ncbi:formyl-CoA transferase [Paenochrobactrum gallinarii]|uniref:Formyl-CoA transferase n=1 Tax=Paenochrobactrum gallinarii TaxID=643673 RepID=A0A841M1F8_9HYPH|nr:CoA transferase [Paenochrobactrum gallinarii]MBB6262582.1 formyl-CoA transferase [Paenochrobactrum gallinarii]